MEQATIKFCYRSEFNSTSATTMTITFMHGIAHVGSTAGTGLVASSESSVSVSDVSSSPAMGDASSLCSAVDVVMPLRPITPFVDDSWVSKFTIPWAKCPSSLIAAVENGTVPSAVDLKELVSHTMSDVFSYTRRAPRSSLQAIASKIVDRQPKSFADYINGVIVGDGVSSLMLMLESKKENLNRRQPNTEPKRKKPSESYGCQNWSPTLPDGETLEKMERHRAELCTLYDQYENSACYDSSTVDRLMLATYCYQRYHVNCGMTVAEVLTKWPFLGRPDYFLRHCKYLTGMDVEAKLRAELPSKVALIYQFLSESNSTLTKHAVECIRSAEKPRWPLYWKKRRSRLRRQSHRPRNKSVSNWITTWSTGSLMIWVRYPSEDHQELEERQTS